jgi:hypothetical protein
MKRFLKRHEDRIDCIISGFDRLLFRGNISSICYPEGMARFLSSQKVLLKDFEAFAQKITRRVIEHAQQIAQEAGRVYHYEASPKTDKAKLARELAEQGKIREGLVCVIGCVEPCRTFRVERDRAHKELKLKAVNRQCMHLYFYYIHPEFGWMHVRLQSWLPLTIQVCINGREFLATRLLAQGIDYEQRDNCFTFLADPQRAQGCLDTLVQVQWAEILSPFAEQVNPWLDEKANPQLHSYYWTVREAEWATDVLFGDSQDLARLYPHLVRHAIEAYDAPNVLRFLGKRMDIRFNGEVRSELRRRDEGVRVRHWVDENSIKMYDKAGLILRIEVTLNSPRRFSVRRSCVRKGQTVTAWYPMRKGVVDLRRMAEISQGANERYLDALAVVGDPVSSHHILDPVSRRVHQHDRPFRALRPISPEDAAIFQAVLAGEHSIQGFRNRDLQPLFCSGPLTPQEQRRLSARVGRLISLLRAHSLLYRVRKTNYYRITEKGHLVMSTAVRFRQRDVALLAA